MRNAGLANRDAQFLSIGGRQPIFFTSADVRMVDPRQKRSLWLMFVDSKARTLDGGAPTGGHVTILRRANPTSDAMYSDVVYRRVWPGIDAHVSGTASGIKYSFEVAPGADPQRIHLRYDGADRMSLTSGGELTLFAGDTTIVDRKPVASQEIGGRTVPVEVRFVQRGDNDVTFAIGKYDRTRHLTIDPTLVYSTYLGSSGNDIGRAIAVDSTGAAYVAGSSNYFDLPVTPGAFQPTWHGDPNTVKPDAFIAKINAAGTHFDYVTYLGGTEPDEAIGIAVDAGGNAYVTGYTESTDFPVTAGAYRTTKGVTRDDGFLTKLNSDGTAVLYSTFFGANGNTISNGVAIDGAANAYVTGRTDSNNLPVTVGGQPLQGHPFFDTHGFLLKFSAAGDAVVYGTYIGGDSTAAFSVAVTGAGTTFVAGVTSAFDGIAGNTISGTNGQVVQGSLNGPTFKSIDGGNTFANANTPTASSSAFAIDPTNPSTVYQGTGDTGVLKTTDGGAHWAIAGSSLGAGTHILDLAMNPATPDTLLATEIHSGTWRSADGGATWTKVSTSGDFVKFAALAPTIAYATVSDGVVKSTDAGVTWTRVFTAPFLVQVNDLAIDPSNASIVYVAYNFGQVLKTTNGGATWTTLTLPVPSTGSSTTEAVAVDPTLTAVVWAGDATGHLFRSTDSGNTWTQATTAPVLLGIYRMVFDGGTLYVSENDRPFDTLGRALFGIVKTSDRGTTWSPLKIRGNALAIRGLAASNGLVYAGGDLTSDAFLWRVDTNDGAQAIKFGTYLGGSNFDVAHGVAVDRSGNVAVALETDSADLPTTINGPVTRTALVRVSSNGTSIAASSYVGTSNTFNSALAVAVDGNNDAFVARGIGTTATVDRIDPSGVDTASFAIGGTQSNVGAPQNLPLGVATGSTPGDVFLTGFTTTTDFPTTPNAPQPFYGSGAGDAFIAKISFGGSTPPPPTNLALNKPVFVSSEFGPQYAGSFAVDGDVSTRWSSQFSDREWIYVDLGQRYAIGEVVLRWETAFGADYQVQVSNDSNHWTTVRTVTGGDGGVDDLTGLSGTGRYVRILGTRRGTEWGYSLFEFEVYGSPAPPPADIALNKPVVTSSDFSSQYAGSFAVDGEPSTRWSSQFSDPQWIYVDLGQRFQINEVKLTWETAFGADYEIQISNDAKNWVTWASATNNTQLTNDLHGGGIGRYVRMYGTRRATEWGYSLWSFEVFGDPITDNTDLALNRPATSSSDFSSEFAAAFAVDGDASTRWSSQFSDPQWIAVDLGQITVINEVRLTWETAYGADYEIQLSFDGINWSPALTVTGGTGGVDDLVVGGTGRYIRMNGTRRGTEWGYSLWSFEVFGNPGP